MMYAVTDAKITLVVWLLSVAAAVILYGLLRLLMRCVPALNHASLKQRKLLYGCCTVASLCGSIYYTSPMIEYDSLIVWLLAVVKCCEIIAANRILEKKRA